MPIAEIAAVSTGIATFCKYTADYLKLRKDGKSAEENKLIRDYVEACRRKDHAETLGRFDLIGEQLTGFEALLKTLSGLKDDQAQVVLDAIEQGNFSLLSALKLSDESTHAKLDQIVHMLGVQPVRCSVETPSVGGASNWA